MAWYDPELGKGGCPGGVICGCLMGECRAAAKNYPAS